MTADLLQFEHTGSTTLSFIIGTAALAVIVFAVASLTSLEDSRDKLKPVRLLATILCLVAGVAGIIYSVNSFDDVRAQNEQHRERTTALVQQWAEETYGVTVDDDEAWEMVGGITHPVLLGGGTYTVLNGGRLLKVELDESKDGSFHLVQMSEELALAEKD